MALTAKLGPTGSEYAIPDTGLFRADYRWEEVKATHELHDGSKKFYHKGYKFRARLEFHYMPQATYDGLRAEYNRHTELNFIPRFTDYPSTNFEVRWMNEWNFVYSSPQVKTHTIPYWRGYIELEGTEIISSIPAWA
ncbi:MAG: hypothetical protein HWN68_18150 [Desulfobacterales bacterium]|nr:hypothetical protein [Desulfobacterales bacterium]